MDRCRLERFNLKWRNFGVVFLLLLLAGCGHGEDTPGTDGGEDAPIETSVDTEGELGVDSIDDSVPDTITDPGDEDESIVCYLPKVDCGGECILLDNDPDHCGSCFNACPEPTVCYESHCSPACPTHMTNCDRACVLLDSDEYNRGECGNDCGMRPCVDGTCI